MFFSWTDDDINTLSDDILSYIFILASTPKPKSHDFDEFTLIHNDYQIPWEDYEGEGEEYEYYTGSDSDEDKDNDKKIPFLFNFGWYSKQENARVAITHTCRRWRRVALQTSSIWARLEFFPRSSYAMCTEFLTRSKQAPLSITVGRTTGGGTSGLNVDRIFNDFVVPHFSRVRRLCICVAPQHRFDIQFRIARITTLPAPLLEEFIVSANHDCVGHVIPSAPGPIFQNDAPHLHTLQLFNIVFLWDSSNGLYRGLFANLTTIKLRQHHTLGYSGPSVDQFFEMVTTSPKLTVLHLEGTGPRLTPIFSDETVSSRKFPLPSLRKLSIKNKKISYMTSVIQRLQMPKLESMRLEILPASRTSEPQTEARANLLFHELMAPRGDAESLASSPPAFTTRRPILSGIKTLDLSGHLPCDLALIPKFYASMPDLHSLHLDMRVLNSTFFSTLYTEPSSTSNLKVMSCTKMGPTNDIAALVRERKEAGFGLQRLLVDQSDEYKLDYRARLYVSEASHVEFDFRDLSVHDEDGDDQMTLVHNGDPPDPDYWGEEDSCTCMFSHDHGIGLHDVFRFFDVEVEEETMEEEEEVEEDEEEEEEEEEEGSYL